MKNPIRCLLMLWAGIALAQAPGTAQTLTQPIKPIGVVTQLQPGSFNLRTDTGPDLLILLPDGISVVRVPPGAKDLSAASKITLGDISPGDRVLVRGRVSDDQKSVLASGIIVMTKTDLTGARETERLDWQRRGIEGQVSAVNSQTREITLSVPTTPPTPGNSTHAVTVALAANAVLLRYAPDSVKFSDAKPSTVVEIKVGDQVRALGTKSDDGSRFTAEKLVSGTFRNLGATVVSVDAPNGTVTVKELASGTPLVVHTNTDSKLRRLPPTLAQMVAKFNSGGDPGIPSGDFQQTLERTPAMLLSELKPGDALIVVSTEGATPAEVTAIMVFAGPEPILAAQPKGSNQIELGPWKMGAGEGGP